MFDSMVAFILYEWIRSTKVIKAICENIHGKIQVEMLRINHALDFYKQADRTSD